MNNITGGNRMKFFMFGAAICVFLLGFQFLSASSAPKKLSSYDPQAKALLSKMTLEEKIGQMTQPDQEYILQNPEDIQKYFIGSLLSGGNSDPKEGNSLEAWTNLYDQVQKEALKTRLAIPILYGIDAVHGHSNVLGAVMFPHNIALGCTRDPALVEKIGRITAEEVRATGIQWTFAPCVAVPQDIRWGRTYEGFSEDPALVRSLGEAAVRGMQGDLSDPQSILACAKHFVGDGGTTASTAGRPGPGVAPGNNGRLLVDQGDTQVDEATLRRVHLQGYISAVKAGVGSIMPSYSSWNGVKCSGSKRLLTEILKQELGFEGFLISDYNAIGQVNPKDYKNSVEISINAGMDMAMEPSNYQKFFNTLKELVTEGKVPMSRIDDAVTRILRVKFALGMMDKNRSQLANRKLHSSFGSAGHRAVAREAVRKCLVLLKNERKALPISKQLARIHVSGKNADNIGNQCGGWTIQWQGQSGAVTPGGTTILAAIKAAVPKTEVTYSLDGTGAQGASIGIVVVGERPYAEGVGDRSELSLDKEDLDAISNVKITGIPVVVLLISGRPMIIDHALPQADAFMTAFLPGTEGQGVADVLFGDFKPTGKLSFSWPKSMNQLPLNINGPKDKYDPLFAFGYGLTY
jgi:beta-glucosidase